MGHHGDENIEKDISSVLRKVSAAIHVTPGVHDEVATARMQRWQDKPRLLDAFGNLLETTPIDVAQVRGLANRIGLKASPQDVDLSLMVLASRLAGKGEEVILVSDDYKMTTTSERLHLPFRTCPPSTFFQRLSDMSTGRGKTRLRGLSRKVRGEEMRYAISRSGQYDIQSKLTWMIDTLLQRSVPMAEAPDVADSVPDEIEMVNTLRRHMLGERIKKSKLTQVASLADACLEIASLSDLISEAAEEMKQGHTKMELYVDLQRKGSEVIADFGLAMAPLTAEKALVAHRAVAPTLCRLETFLGLMAKAFGDLDATRSHLARGLHHATLIDDDQAEAQALFHLGLVELATDSHQRAAVLFEAAAREGKRVDFMRVELSLAAAICRQLSGDEQSASVHIETVQRMVEGNEGESINGLSHLGEALLSIGRPMLALEVFDEALECAVESGAAASAVGLADSIARCNAALTGQEGSQLARMRSLLDRVNAIGGDAVQRFLEQVEAIEDKRLQQQEPLPQTWSEWQPSAKLMGDDSSLEVLRAIREDGNLMLLICYHRELGNLGIWLPDSKIATSPNSRYRLDAGATRVKVAHPPEKIGELHNIRGLIAVEQPDSLTLEVVSEVT
jgi:tetratricopeptide (TPR) repeat protein